MAETLEYKAELAVLKFIETEELDALADYSYHAGGKFQQQEPPCVCVFFTGMQEAWDNAAPQNVSLSVEIVTLLDPDGDDDGIAGKQDDRLANASAHRAAVKAVRDLLQDEASLQAFANETNVTDRPVSAFYIYAINDIATRSTAVEDRVICTSIGVTLVCEEQDN